MHLRHCQNFSHLVRISWIVRQCYVSEVTAMAAPPQRTPTPGQHPGGDGPAVPPTQAFLSWSLLCFRPLPPSLSPPARIGGDEELRAEEEAAIAGNTALPDAALVASADDIPG